MHALFWLGLFGALTSGWLSPDSGEQRGGSRVFPVVVALLEGLGGEPDWQDPARWEVSIDGNPTKVIGVNALLPPLFWGDDNRNAPRAAKPAHKSLSSGRCQASVSVLVLANVCSSSTLRLAVQNLSRDRDDLLKIGPINVMVAGKTPEILCKDVREKTLLTKCFSRLSRISVSNEIIQLRRELGDKRKGPLTPTLALAGEAGTLLAAARSTRIALDEIGMYPTVLFLIWDGAEESGIDFWRHQLAASSSGDRALLPERGSLEQHLPHWEDLLREADVYLAEAHPFRGFGDLAASLTTKGVVVVSLVPPLPAKNEKESPFDRRRAIQNNASSPRGRSEAAPPFSPGDLPGLTPQDAPLLLAAETGGLVLSPRVMVRRDLTPLANRVVLWVQAASRGEGLAAIQITKAPRQLVWAAKACCGSIPEPLTTIRSAQGQRENSYKKEQPFGVTIRAGQLPLAPQLAFTDGGTNDGRRTLSLSIGPAPGMTDLRTTSFLAGTVIRKRGNERYFCDEWMWHGSELQMERDTLIKRLSLPISGPLESISFAVVDVNSGALGLVVVEL